MTTTLSLRIGMEALGCNVKQNDVPIKQIREAIAQYPENIVEILLATMSMSADVDVKQIAIGIAKDRDKSFS